MRARRLVGAVALVAVAWFFGGLPGALVGAALAVALLRGASPSFFWAVGTVAVPVAAFAVLFQGLGPVAGPAFGEHHWVAHLAVGLGLASLTVAAVLDVGALRRGGAWPEPAADAPPPAGDAPAAGERSASSPPA